MGTNDERLAQRDTLEKECERLEALAAISAMIERAREGRFIPLGVFGDDASPSEYFADEYDCFRQRLRDAYFSVSDVTLRKELIAARRKLDNHRRDDVDVAVIEANRDLAGAKSKAASEPWSLAALVAGIAVAVGYWAFDMPGAIGGAVSGWFLGQGIIANFRRDSQTQVGYSLAAVEQAKKDKAEQGCYPPLFSSSEEFGGERDETLDAASAYGNILRGSAEATSA